MDVLMEIRKGVHNQAKGEYEISGELRVSDMVIERYVRMKSRISYDM